MLMRRISLILPCTVCVWAKSQYYIWTLVYPPINQSSSKSDSYSLHKSDMMAPWIRPLLKLCVCCKPLISVVFKRGHKCPFSRLYCTFSRFCASVNNNYYQKVVINDVRLNKKNSTDKYPTTWNEIWILMLGLFVLCIGCYNSWHVWTY